MTELLPTTIEEYAAALAAMSERSKIVSGGTDYVIQARRGKFDPDFLLYPGLIPSLHEITLTADALRIGAMATMSEIARALSAHPAFAAIADAAGDVGSPQVRSKATMAGNLCNASPAGDTLPIARLYDAQVETLDGSGSVQHLGVDELILGPQKNALAHDQAVTAVCIDRARFNGYVSAFRKIGSRERVSIARIGLGAMVRLDESGYIEDARLSLGAVANKPLRVPEAEELMRGKRLDGALFDLVHPVIAQTVHDNCRPANRLYKTEAARGLTADVFALLQKRLQEESRSV